jgi:hypothetical protein
MQYEADLALYTFGLLLATNYKIELSVPQKALKHRYFSEWFY